MDVASYNQRIEFLLEEPSMENVLTVILPQILPQGYELGINCFLRPHQGKHDLKKSIPKKMKVFSNYHQPTKIVILHDQDSNDCKALKADLQKICTQSGTCEVLIRIPCRELENWYLGDMRAIEAVYPNFKRSRFENRQKFRVVDQSFGSKELMKNIKNFQKGHASRTIPLHMDIAINRSESFKQFVRGVQSFLS